MDECFASFAYSGKYGVIILVLSFSLSFVASHSDNELFLLVKVPFRFLFKCQEVETFLCRCCCCCSGLRVGNCVALASVNALRFVWLLACRNYRDVFAIRLRSIFLYLWNLCSIPSR